MTLRIVLSLMAVSCMALAATPAHATSNYEYKKDEYAVIRDGLSPDKRMSLASHGEGELGDDDFHVWLMAEPEHRRLIIAIA